MRIGLLLALIVLTGCARSQMSYENRDEDVISFSERLVIDFSSGMDKAIHRFQGNNIYRSGQYTVFEKDFFPMNAGYNGVRQAYQIHCEKQSGRFQNDSCINQNEELLYKISLSPGEMWVMGGLRPAGGDDIRSTLLVVRKPNTSMRVAQAPKTTKPETSSFKFNIDQYISALKHYPNSASLKPDYTLPSNEEHPMNFSVLPLSYSEKCMSGGGAHMEEHTFKYNESGKLVWHGKKENFRGKNTTVVEKRYHYKNNNNLSEAVVHFIGPKEDTTRTYIYMYPRPFEQKEISVLFDRIKGTTTWEEPRQETKTISYDPTTGRVTKKSVTENDKDVLLYRTGINSYSPEGLLVERTLIGARLLSWGRARNTGPKIDENFRKKERFSYQFFPNGRVSQMRKEALIKGNWKLDYEVYYNEMGWEVQNSTGQQYFYKTDAKGNWVEMTVVRFGKKGQEMEKKCNRTYQY